MQESDAPVPTCQLSLRQNHLFYLVLYKEKVVCFNKFRDDLSESDAPVPTGQRNLIGRIIFFSLVLYKEKVVCFNMYWATWGSLALPRPISRIIPIGGAVQSNSFASRFY